MRKNERSGEKEEKKNKEKNDVKIIFEGPSLFPVLQLNVKAILYGMAPPPAKTPILYINVLNALADNRWTGKKWRKKILWRISLILCIHIRSSSITHVAPPNVFISLLLLKNVFLSIAWRILFRWQFQFATAIHQPCRCLHSPRYCDMFPKSKLFALVWRALVKLGGVNTPRKLNYDVCTFRHVHITCWPNSNANFIDARSLQVLRLPCCRNILMGIP